MVGRKGTRAAHGNDVPIPRWILDLAAVTLHHCHEARKAGENRIPFHDAHLADTAFEDTTRIIAAGMRPRSRMTDVTIDRNPGMERIATMRAIPFPPGTRFGQDCEGLQIARTRSVPAADGACPVIQCVAPPHSSR